MAAEQELLTLYFLGFDKFVGLMAKNGVRQICRTLAVEGGALGDGTERDRRARYGPDTGDLTSREVRVRCNTRT